MNEVFLIGKIISKVEFKFIINSKKTKSMANFTMETEGKQHLMVRIYNHLADFAYKKLEKDKRIFVYGELRREYILAKRISIL